MSTKTGPEQGMRGGDERVGRGDDLAGDAQGLQGGGQGQRAVGEKAQVLHAEVARQFLFKLLVEAPAVGEMPAFPYLFETGNELLQRREERPGDENFLVWSRHVRE
jgi:hypothetical protein